MSDYIDLAALGRVLLASLVAGVGLVSVFGLGLVGLSAHEGALQDAQGLPVRGARRGSPAGLLLAATCLVVVLAGVGLGLWSILD